MESNYRNGIEVMGISADGDNRLLSSMIHNSKLIFSIESDQWFNDQNRSICYIQDVVHNGLKLRNRLLKPSVLLKIGEKIASLSHLKILLNRVPKDEHGLTYSVICPDDRQNYDSLVRIMQPRVKEALSKYVIGSEATIEYIRICSEVTSSLYEDNLQPIDRLFRLWRSTYFLRAWRLFIGNAETGKISSNFITRNAYACVELNAQNLVLLIKKFRENNLSELFLPTLFNSQPCEETFRKMRSMGSINFTKINFTLLELMHLVGRVEILNDIIHVKLVDYEVKFPRNRLINLSNEDIILPTDTEIEECLQQALDTAILDASNFGISVAPEDISVCELREGRITFTENILGENIDLKIAEGIEKEPIACQSLKDYSAKISSLHGSTSFVEVEIGSGKKSVRKSSLIGLLSDSKGKLSSDRLKRTQNITNDRSVRRKLEFFDMSPQNRVLNQMNELQIGDWCLFRNQFSSTEDERFNFILGNILSFKYVNGRTEKDKQYSLDFAPIQHSSNLRGVEVLSSWYGIDRIGKISAEYYCFFTNIDQYIATFSREIIFVNENKQIHLCDKFLNTFQREFEILITQQERNNS